MTSLQKLIVSAYKGIGFVVLTAILLGLASYIGVNLFYMVNSSWLAPTVVSPTDERVLQLNAQLAQQTSLREKLAADRADLNARLLDADRTIAMQEGFQRNFELAVEADLNARRAELLRLQRLSMEYINAKQEIQRSNDAYAGMSREQLAELKGAHLVEDEHLVNVNFQLSQITHSNLSLEEKQVALDTKTAQLQHEIGALHAAKSQTQRSAGSGEQPSYDALRIQQEYTKSFLEVQKAKDTSVALKQSIAAIDAALARYDRMLKTIQDSPYIKATEHHLTVAFVPYENLKNVPADAPVYGCRLNMLFCHQVGRVTAVLEGEVSIKHPLHNQAERGQMVQIEVEDASARERVLFAGRAPLFL